MSGGGECPRRVVLDLSIFHQRKTGHALSSCPGICTAVGAERVECVAWVICELLSNARDHGGQRGTALLSFAPGWPMVVLELPGREFDSVERASLADDQPTHGRRGLWWSKERLRLHDMDWAWQYIEGLNVIRIEVDSGA